MVREVAITAEDVREAARRLSGVAVRTPLLEYASLNERAGARVLVKFEGAQHAGSFKFRGAYNRLSRLTPHERRAGVVAWSSGNHAQGVAAAARVVGTRATIVMPSDAPAIKLANTRALGAEVVPYGRRTQSREEIATALSHERGAVLVPSFDDPFIIAGQGTVGLEALEDARAMGADPRRVLVCCGGGGLVAGIATAVCDIDPRIKVHSVEPAGFDDTARSLRSGRREETAAGAASICDALLAPSPGKLTFPINRVLLSEGLTVTDAQVREAMRLAFTSMKLVVEPGGAVALAAVLAGRCPDAGEGDLLVIVSGSNVDPDLFSEIIQEAA